MSPLQNLAQLTSSQIANCFVLGTAIAALAGAGLVQAAPEAGAQLTFTAAGRVLVENLRGETRDIIARAYGDIPAEDLATTGRVLTAITARISEELAAN